MALALVAIGLLVVFLVWGIPIWLCVDICKTRHRDPLKGAFIAAIFGWLAVAGVWLALKRRDPKTLILY